MASCPVRFTPLAVPLANGRINVASVLVKEIGQNLRGFCIYGNRARKIPKSTAGFSAE
jgi:hypothetical protein